MSSRRPSNKQWMAVAATEEQRRLIWKTWATWKICLAQIIHEERGQQIRKGFKQRDNSGTYSCLCSWKLCKTVCQEYANEALERIFLLFLSPDAYISSYVDMNQMLFWKRCRPFFTSIAFYIIIEILYDSRQYWERDSIWYAVNCKSR